MDTFLPFRLILTPLKSPRYAYDEQPLFPPLTLLSRARTIAPNCTLVPGPSSYVNNWASRILGLCGLIASSKLYVTHFRSPRSIALASLHDQGLPHGRHTSPLSSLSILRMFITLTLIVLEVPALRHIAQRPRCAHTK